MTRLASVEDLETGLYQYCRLNHTGPQPVGYCGTNCAGHGTAAEAAEHYKEFLLDHLARYDRCRPEVRVTCHKCGKPTARYAEVPGVFSLPLCKQHCNREILSEAFVVED